MGGSMARKKSRAPNGHPAELKKEEETAVQQLVGGKECGKTRLISGLIPATQK